MLLKRKLSVNCLHYCLSYEEDVSLRINATRIHEGDGDQRTTSTVTAHFETHANVDPLFKIIKAFSYIRLVSITALQNAQEHSIRTPDPQGSAYELFHVQRFTHDF